MSNSEKYLLIHYAPFYNNVGLGLRGLPIERKRRSLFFLSRKREKTQWGATASDVLELKRVLTVGGCP